MTTTQTDSVTAQKQPDQTEAGAAQGSPLPENVLTSPPAQDFIIEAHNLSVVFPDARTIGPVSFSIPVGESALILGPSGCGKSTFFKALTGVIPHSIHADRVGDVSIAGRDITSTEPHENADILGVIAQDPWTSVCLPTVEDDIAFSLENACVPRDKISLRVAEVADLLSISHLLARPTTQLSGGELQRVALAAAIATEPQVLLLDEPTAMLDSTGIHAVVEAVESISTTRVLIEHRLDEIAHIRDDALPSVWIVLARDGSVLWQGRKTDIDQELAALLLQHGCWLPLDIELLAHFGESGGLGSPVVQNLLKQHLSLFANGYSSQVSATGDSSVAQLDPVDNTQVSEVLSAHNVSVSYKKPVSPARAIGRRKKSENVVQQVLQDVSFQVSAGEIVALVGANGCGKTTLLRALAGVNKNFTGTVSGPRSGIVFQNPEHQFMTNTVRAELAHNVCGVESPQVEAMLHKFGLQEVAHLSPYALSGGQKRRLSLAAMLMHQRPFLLADEPTFGLDRHGTSAVMNAFEELSAQGQGVVFSSHDLRTVATFAHRIVVMSAGTIVAEGSAWDIFRDPDTLKSAGLFPPPLPVWIAQNTSSPQEFQSALLNFFSSEAPAVEEEK